MHAANGLRHCERAMCAYSAFVVVSAMYESPWLRFASALALMWFAFGALCARLPLPATVALLCIVPATPGLLATALAVVTTIALRNIVSRVQLQAKGIGSIVMFVTAFAIAVVLVPRAQSETALVALDLLIAFVTALGAWMLSWLCRLAVGSLEHSDADLPTARVV